MRIADLLEHHEKRLEECLDVVRSNPDLTIYDIAGKMTWNTLQFVGGLSGKPEVVCCRRMPQPSPPSRKAGKVEAYEDGELTRYRAI